MPQQPPRPLPGASDERFDPSNAPPRRLPFELQHGAAPIVDYFRPWEERMAPVAPVATVVAQQQPPPPPRLAQPAPSPAQQPARSRSQDTDPSELLSALAGLSLQSNVGVSSRRHP